MSRGTAVSATSRRKARPQHQLAGDHPVGQDQALVADVVPDGIDGPHPLDQAGFDGGPLAI